MINQISRRRLLGAMITSAVLVAAVTAGLMAHGPDQDPPAVPKNLSRPSSGERLIPDLAFVVNRPPDQPAIDLNIPFFEVFPDGTVGDSQLRLPDGMALSNMRTLPDGRVLVLATHDLMPAVERQDGPAVDGIAFPLLVIDRRGRLVSQRDIRVVGEIADLVGSTSTEAIVQRYAPAGNSRPASARIVAHNFATGRERSLWSATAVATHGDFAGRRLVLAGGVDGGDASCWLRLLQMDTPSRTRILLPACDQVVGLNAAPNARVAAVVYERMIGDIPELHLTTIDLQAGIIRTDEVLNRHQPCTSCIYPAHAGYLGMAWSNDHTLNLALMGTMPIDVNPDRILAEIQHRIRIETRNVIWTESATTPR